MMCNQTLSFAVEQRVLQLHQQKRTCRSAGTFWQLHPDERFRLVGHVLGICKWSNVTFLLPLKF